MSQGQITMVIGYPASGKSTYALREFPHHHRVNRDTIGGKIEGLVPYIEKKITEGHTQFVLDNTHANVASRAMFIKLAKKHGFLVKCHWMKTSAEDAQFNAALRMVRKYGRILDTAEIKKLQKEGDPNTFPINVIFSFRNSFEPPTLNEGFDELVEVPYVRELPAEYCNKALILDYDGTLRDTISGNNYPLTPDDIKILPNRREVLARYKEQGYVLLGVSNQSGIHKGIMTSEQSRACFEKTNEMLGHSIDFRFCPHASGPISCFCRKPVSGHGCEFIEKYKLDPSKCIFVGDLGTDKSFAYRCGFQYFDCNDFFKLSRAENKESDPPSLCDVGRR